MNSKELLNALSDISLEKGITKETIFNALETALLAAYKKNFDQETNVEVKINPENGQIKVFQKLDIVEDGNVKDENTEISESDAINSKKRSKLGNVFLKEITPSNFGRFSAQAAKQVVSQNLRNAEREAVYDKFIDYEDEIVNAIVDREDTKNIVIVIGDGQEAVLMDKDKLKNENYKIGKRIKVLLKTVKKGTKGNQLFVSRTDPDLVKRLFELEVPEVYEGIVEIVNVSRDPGERSKLSVFSNDPNLDPVGTMVGLKGTRVQDVVDELNGENMDIVEWTDDKRQYIANALNPSDVIDVIFTDEDSATVIVPDSQLSLAIGKKGQNARLAARLTGFKIDIKSESEYNKEVEKNENTKDTEDTTEE